MATFNVEYDDMTVLEVAFAATGSLASYGEILDGIAPAPPTTLEQVQLTELPNGVGWSPIMQQADGYGDGSQIAADSWTPRLNAGDALTIPERVDNAAALRKAPYGVPIAAVELAAAMGNQFIYDNFANS